MFCPTTRLRSTPRRGWLTEERVVGSVGVRDRSTCASWRRETDEMANVEGRDASPERPVLAAPRRGSASVRTLPSRHTPRPNRPESHGKTKTRPCKGSRAEARVSQESPLRQCCGWWHSR